MAQPPGRLIGAGRTADVYALGRGRVLRRYRGDSDVAAEAAAMAYLAGAGYPVPEVYHADGRDLVLERLDGRDMLADLTRVPSRVRRHARTLARARMADASVRPAEAEHLRRVAEEAGEGGKAGDPGGPG